MSTRPNNIEAQYYQSIVQNSLQHFQIAELIANKSNASYGHAIIHVTYAIEEQIRSTFSFLKHQGFNIEEYKKLKKINSDHHFKHNMAFLITILGILLPLIQKSNIITKFINGIKVYQKLKTLKSDNSWWAKVENNRLQCIYVGMNDKIISTPGNFSKQDYLEAKKYYKNLVSNSNKIKKLINSYNTYKLKDLQKYINKKEVKEMIRTAISKIPTEQDRNKKFKSYPKG